MAMVPQRTIPEIPVNKCHTHSSTNTGFQSIIHFSRSYCYTAGHQLSDFKAKMHGIRFQLGLKQKC